jgi:hypothetical protein
MAARPLPWHWLALAFVFGIGHPLGRQHLMRPPIQDGAHLHPWLSEDMLQTVSWRGVDRLPLQSLTNIHVWLPAFDAFRSAPAGVAAWQFERPSLSSVTPPSC